MTDDDLGLLYDEEVRLYRVYRKAVEEEARYPAKVEAARNVWIALHGKVNEVLTFETRARILHDRVTKAMDEKRRKR